MVNRFPGGNNTGGLPGQVNIQGIESMSNIQQRILIAAFSFAVASTATAGLPGFGKSACGDCGDACCDAGCCKSSCCPGDYCCEAECKTVPLKRHCFETECKAVVVPPITLPCCKCGLARLFGRNHCKAGCSDAGCSENACCNNGILHKLCSGLTKCRVRCVNTYKKKEYECGTKCVCEWKAVCRTDCCENGCCPAGAHCSAGCAD